jgi:hypothetical protein
MPEWRLLIGLFAVDANTPGWRPAHKLWAAPAFS